MDESNSFNFDSSDLSSHEQALIDAINEGKDLSQSGGSFDGGPLPASIKKSKKKGNLLGSLVSSFSKNAAAFVKDDSGGNSGASTLERTNDRGSSIKKSTNPSSLLEKTAKNASQNISERVNALSGANSTTILTPFQLQELLILNHIKDDVSTIADLIKDLDGKPSTKGTTDLLKGSKEDKPEDDLLSKIIGGLAGLGGLITGIIEGLFKGFHWPELPKFHWPKLPEFHWPKITLPWSNSTPPSGPKSIPKPGPISRFFKPSYQPKHMTPPKPNIFSKSMGGAKRALGTAIKGTSKGLSAALGTAAKGTGNTFKLLGKGLGAAAGASLKAIANNHAFKAGRALGRFGGLAGRAAAVGFAVKDVVDDYQKTQTNKDSVHQIGGAINMGLDIVGNAAMLANKTPLTAVAGVPIATAAHTLHTTVQGYMDGPQNRRLEAAMAAQDNEQQDFIERFKNLNFKNQNKSKNWWDLSRYGFETNAEKRDDLVAQLSNKHDAKSLAEIKKLKSEHLTNDKTYKDYDFSSSNMLSNIKSIMPNIQVPHTKIPPVTDFAEGFINSALPSAANIINSSEKALGKAVTTITAPLTQTFSTVFNNATIFSKDEVKKAIDEILKQEHQAAAWEKRASERFGNIGNNTLVPSKAIAILKSKATMT